MHTPTEQALSPLPTTRIRKQTQFLAPEAHCGMGNTELLSRARQTFQRSDKVFLAFGEDLRLTPDKAEFVERDGRRSVHLCASGEGHLYCVSRQTEFTRKSWS